MAAEALTQPDAPQSGLGIIVHSIPMEFYGGKNPEPFEMPVTPASARVVVPASAASQSAAVRPGAATSTITAPKQPAKNKTLMIVLVVLGLAVVLGGGFAVWWFTIRTPAAQQTLPIVPPPPVVAVEPEPEPIPEPPAPVEPAPEPIPEKPVADALIPNHAFKDSADGDADGLTDIEEELWGTNGASIDSDGDTFPDTTEIANLYNPAGLTPERLIEAGLVSTYINPEYQYTVYYPTTWLANAVDADKKEVLFTSITQEFVNIRVLPFPTEMSFAEWFAKTFPTEQLATYTPFVNKFKVSGVKSSDGLVSIITDGAHVYLLTYNGGVREEINYRLTFGMMIQSFKTSSVTTPIDLLPKSKLNSVQSLPPALDITTPTTTQAAAATTTEPAKVDLLPSEVEFITVQP